MNLSTPVTIPPATLRISYDTPLLLLGSCFTDEIGARLQHAGFDLLCNPFGTLYNPLSIQSCLRRAESGELFGERDLVFHDGLHHSWSHHGSFSAPDAAAVLDRCNEALFRTSEFLRRQPVTVITLGTAYAFFLNDPASPHHGRVVANCHKLPAANFDRRRLSVDEVVGAFEPTPKTIFTVSPIRHLADGAHGNQLSKSTLLLAVERLCARGAAYFPSYEIMLDELRDYRFYARDMCHPSDLAVDIIWERFQQTFMDDAVRSRVLLNEKAYRQSQHRPLH